MLLIGNGRIIIHWIKQESWVHTGSLISNGLVSKHRLTKYQILIISKGTPYSHLNRWISSVREQTNPLHSIQQDATKMYIWQNQSPAKYANPDKSKLWDFLKITGLYPWRSRANCRALPTRGESRNTVPNAGVSPEWFLLHKGLHWDHCSNCPEWGRTADMYQSQFSDFPAIGTRITYKSVHV